VRERVVEVDSVSTRTCDPRAASAMHTRGWGVRSGEKCS